MHVIHVNIDIPDKFEDDFILSVLLLKGCTFPAKVKVVTPKGEKIVYFKSGKKITSDYLSENIEK